MGGALALLFPPSHPADAVQFRAYAQVDVFDMPTLDIDGKRAIDHWTLARVLAEWAGKFDVRNSAIERVHAMPKQGVTSSFTFGEGFGALKQAVASAGLPMTLIQPATWKAIYGLRGGKENKDMSRRKASEMFPGAAHLWARKKDDGRAEAVLLAHYASKLQEVK